MDNYCGECGDEFHLDDCGGYNPPCSCGCGCCRSCHDAYEDAEDHWQDDDSSDADTPVERGDGEKA